MRFALILIASGVIACGNQVVDEGQCWGETSVTLRVAYPYAANRTLHVQIVNNTADLGRWWDKTISSDGNVIDLTMDHVPHDCGFRLNVAQGSTKWLCEGSGSNARLDPNAEIVVMHAGQRFTKSGLVAWSTPDLAHGCSALLHPN